MGVNFPHYVGSNWPGNGGSYNWDVELIAVETRISSSAFSHWNVVGCGPRALLDTGFEPCVSVITDLITGSITAHVMRKVNPHYEGFLGDSFTPETPINSLVCYWIRGFDQNFQLSNTKEFNSFVNLLSSSFCPSIFEILFGQGLCYSVHNLKRRFPEDIDIHLVNEK